MKQDDIILTAGTGLMGLSLGFLGASLLSTSPWKIALASLAGGIPTAAATAFIVDNQATARIRKLDKLLGEKKTELVRLSRFEQLNRELVGDLEAYKKRLEQKELELTGSNAFVATQNEGIRAMKNEIEIQQENIKDYEEEISELRQEIEDWVARYDSDLAEDLQFQVDKFATSTINEMTEKDFTVIREASDLSEAYRQLTLFAKEEVSIKNGLIQELAQEFNEKIINYDKAFSAERDEYISLIENYKTQLAIAQKEVKGELLEPDYGQHGYDIPAQIATDLCRNLWNSHQLPLKLYGVKTANGLSTAGYGYGSNQSPTEIVSFIKNQSKVLCKQLGIHQITKVENLNIAPAITVSFRREPVLKESNIKDLVGSPEEFLQYLENQSYRFRLIAKPGSGKSPTIIVLVSHLLKIGGKVANKPTGRKVPLINVKVSYPGRDGSEKDSNYPLDPFLHYRTWEASHQSFVDFEKEWKYREKNVAYRKEIFDLWVWDEFDNSLMSASNPKELGEKFKTCLKQAHHTNMGFIIAGQSVNTKVLPGFTNNDRNTLFTEIVFGAKMIREYIDMYGKKLGNKNIEKIGSTLEDIEEWIINQNKLIGNEAKEYRLVLVADERSPKLFFLPSLDSYSFDYETVSLAQERSNEFKRPSTAQLGQATESVKPEILTSREMSVPTEFRTDFPIGGNLSGHSNVQDTIKYHCPSCGSGNTKPRGKTRFYCLNSSCQQKTFSRSTAVKR
ncbi:MAG: hypothetical protein WBG70_18435 [Spirulinaceae cyanobacterium]